MLVCDFGTWLAVKLFALILSKNYSPCKSNLYIWTAPSLEHRLKSQWALFYLNSDAVTIFGE